MSRYYVKCELCTESLCVDDDEEITHVCDRIERAITAAIRAERHRIAQALRERLDQVGGASLAVMRAVVEAVEGGGVE